MKIKRFEFNMFPVNCYVLWDDTKEAVVIDPGCFYEEEKQALKKFILTNELNVKHLLNTHLHLDHIFGNPFMLKEFGLSAVAYAANDALLNFNQAEEKTQRDKYLRICQEQLQRLSGLVEQILSMSMERRKTFRLHPEVLSMADILEPLIEQHKLKSEKPVHILTKIEPAGLTLTAEIGRAHV